LINPATRAEARQLLSLAVHNPKAVASEAAVDELFATSARSGYANQRFIESIMRREDVLDGKLNALRSPTLIIQGREDKVTPLTLSERFHHDIAGSNFLMIDNCGHSPNVEQADQFNAAVLRFLNGKALTTGVNEH
jgi:pimeloyl-ACP methyl ester carboxylesterase